MIALAGISEEALQGKLRGWGIRPSHAGRLLRAFYAAGGEIAWDELALPAGLRPKLEAEGPLLRSEIQARQTAADGTVKLLLRLEDGRTVESVLMPDYRADRAAGCLSTQVGCAMGCDFCATTKSGFERNLSAGEITEQFLALRREARAGGRKLQTIVFMGMGEPMLNLDAVLEALPRLAENRLGALGWRQLTVSTVGIVPGIDRLAEANLNVHLAVSLHGPDDATRARLIPAGRRYGVEEVLTAADRYQARTGRPVTIQYCLLQGVNDAPEQARLLAERVGARRMHVNLLRYNPTGLSLQGRTYAASPEKAALAFAAVLKQHGVVAHFRRPRGREIDAACGQLRERLAS
ncbi:MAG TPA: 23S rRNA (adenine(2503)-C(2))-methyltransferase RlmN [Opitutaceae bacterium]|jgi:23S rRNA (adenine2503-C2)-methyltransferase|nr:23S rRNA (adenine(2503)-C(2))-methyltransferase RlmN [Opitutaceae bacterium]